MFRQILVDKADIPLQSILWRSSPENSVDIYHLTTVVYGLVCSPYLASRTLKQLAIDDGSLFPRGAKVVKKRVYMDDVMGGEHSINETIQQQKEVLALLKSGGFPLRKWSANQKELLNWLPKELVATDPLNFETADTTTSVLGIAWHPQDDSFRFNLEKISCDEIPTKRTVLSNIARIFDPIGWLAPVVVTAKILMQSLWLLKQDWDVPLPQELVIQWHTWVRDLARLKELKIPRWIGYSPTAKFIEIHGYADASKLAYAAVIYLRIVFESHIVSKIQLAKTRVAPLKTITIPKLELCAAVLLANLVAHFAENLELEVKSIHLHSDAKDVLYWLKSHPSRWPTFVANRCSQIHTLLPSASWHYVKSKENPADQATRGVECDTFVRDNLWWLGPPSLRETQEPWPLEIPTDVPKNSPTVPPLSCNANVSTSPSKNQKPEIWDLVDKYSSSHRLFRITAYCLRFVIKLVLKIRARRKINFELIREKLLQVKNPSEAIASTRARIVQFCSKLANKVFSELSLLDLGYLNISKISCLRTVTVVDLENARLLWVNLHQKYHFTREISLLSKGKPIEPSSRLKTLNPILDRGLLRVGGRLAHALVDADIKNPLILDTSDNLARLLARRAHFTTLHGGTQLTLGTLRRQYWPLRGRDMVRTIVNKCTICIRYSRNFGKQLMGALPSPRVNPSPPFSKSGVDYAGPISVRLTKSRGKGTLKGYISIFICLCTRAVHLELVEDYSSEAFIAAFHRFTARRGYCSELWSDQGTTFVGADTQLKEMFQENSEYTEAIASTLKENGTQWKFNPPSAPHFGGIWEAAVKSTKHHLRRVIGTQILTFVELYTLLCRVEACLNSRPLMPLTDDPSDVQFLSPAHFLIQRASYVVPEEDIVDAKIALGKRWTLVTQMAQQFWRRWSAEYVTSLQQRHKWTKPARSLKEGDLVILRNETTAPAHWPVGRVVQVFPGSDNLTRTVSIQTPTSLLRRPVVKTTLLVPVDE